MILCNYQRGGVIIATSAGNEEKGVVVLEKYTAIITQSQPQCIRPFFLSATQAGHWHIRYKRHNRSTELSSGMAIMLGKVRAVGKEKDVC